MNPPRPWQVWRLNRGRGVALVSSHETQDQAYSAAEGLSGRRAVCHATLVAEGWLRTWSGRSGPAGRRPMDVAIEALRAARPGATLRDLGLSWKRARRAERAIRDTRDHVELVRCGRHLVVSRDGETRPDPEGDARRLVVAVATLRDFDGRPTRERIRALLGWTRRELAVVVEECLEERGWLELVGAWRLRPTAAGRRQLRALEQVAAVQPLEVAHG